MSSPSFAYAASRNAVYKSKDSQVVNLKQRLNDTIATLPKQAQRNWQVSLDKAIKNFKKKYPGIKNFASQKNFKLCVAQPINLWDGWIDITMQRQPDLKWILKIINNFKPFMVQPIQVFEADYGWAGWDGQHTALALMLIAEHAFGLDEKTEILIPGNLYDINNRSEARYLFLGINTTSGNSQGKMPLDHIDKAQQMIHGVQNDGVKDPEWENMWQKNEYIAKANMFLTHAKFADDDEPGAISRLDEIMKSSVEVVRQFAVYGNFVVNTQVRAIDTKELPIIMAFLNMCQTDNIVYSDAEIEEIAALCIDLFDANFHEKSIYWQQAYQANLNAYDKICTTTYGTSNKHLWPAAPKNLKNVPVGTNFFWYLLKHHWVPTKPAGFRLPMNPFGNQYVPSANDLF
jgi:hypothetical protein